MSSFFRTVFRAGLPLLFAVLVLATQFAVHPVLAQETATEPIAEQLDQTSKTVDFINRVIESADGDDDTLIGARSKLLDMRTVVNTAVAPVRTKLESVNQAIAKIGAPTEDPSDEDAILTAERHRLNRERSELLVLVTRHDQLISRIDTDIDEIGVLRRDAFTQEITKRTPISVELFASLAQDLAQMTLDIRNVLSNWFNDLLKNETGKLGLSGVLALILSLTFRWFTRNVIRLEMPEEPSQFQLLSNALVRTLIPTLTLGIGAVVFIVALTIFDIYPAPVEKVISPVLLAAISYFFVSALISNIFSPYNAEMRLVPFTRHAASRISTLLKVLTGIQVLDYIFSNLAKAVNAPLSVTIANSFVAALLIGLTLMAVLLVKKDKGLPQRALARWIRLPVLLMSVGIIMAAFAGYVGLSRFVAQQIVITSAIAVTIFLAIKASRELGEPGGLDTTGFGRWVSASFDTPPERLDQYGLVISLGLTALTLIVGIPSLALQWGSRVDDIWTFIKQLFFGINIGSFSFSLGNILLGVCIFALIWFVTRLFQRWLSRSVLSRTKADVGVRNSITTFVGYAGLAIASLIGVTAAGFNLASLAIVAGALSLGIGFGLQNVVSNFVSGLILLVERPIKVGDFIETGNFSGTIKKISVRATELETIHRMSVIVPNSELINSPVGNWTHKVKSGRIDLPIGVAYGTDYKRVRTILLECAALHHPIVMKEPAPFVFFVGFGESSVDFQLRVHLRDWTQNPAIQSEILFDICDAFAKENIEIPFPQRDLNIRSIDEKAAKVLAAAGNPTSTTKVPSAAKRKRTQAG